MSTQPTPPKSRGRPKGSKNKAKLPAAFQLSPSPAQPPKGTVPLPTPITQPPPLAQTLDSLAPALAKDPDWAILAPEESYFLYQYFTTGFDDIAAYQTTFHPGSNKIHEKERRIYANGSAYILNRPHVVKALKALTNYFLAERKVTYAPRILQVLEAQAFYDPGDFLTSEGDLKVSLTDLTLAQRLCIEHIDTKYYGKDADRSVTTVKLVARHRAMEMLARYITLFAETPAITINQQNNVIQQAIPTDARARLASIFGEVQSAKLTPSTNGSTNPGAKERKALAAVKEVLPAKRAVRGPAKGGK